MNLACYTVLIVVAWYLITGKSSHCDLVALHMCWLLQVQPAMLLWLTVMALITTTAINDGHLHHHPSNPNMQHGRQAPAIQTLSPTHACSVNDEDGHHNTHGRCQWPLPPTLSQWHTSTNLNYDNRVYQHLWLQQHLWRWMMIRPRLVILARLNINISCSDFTACSLHDRVLWATSNHRGRSTDKCFTFFHLIPVLQC